MDILRLVVMTILEVLKDLVTRLGQKDLAERCEECQHEVEAYDELKNKEGGPDG